MDGLAFGVELVRPCPSFAVASRIVETDGPRDLPLTPVEDALGGEPGFKGEEILTDDDESDEEVAEKEGLEEALGVVADAITCKRGM